jgi:hypothetical protein
MGVCAFGYTTYWSIQQAELRQRTSGESLLKEDLKAQVISASNKLVTLEVEEQDLITALQIVSAQKTQAEIELRGRKEAYQAVLFSSGGGSLQANVTGRASGSATTE